MLGTISGVRLKEAKHLLSVQHICYPEHSLTLLNFGRVQIKSSSFLVQPYTMRQSNSGCDEEVSGLGVWCTEQK